MWLWPHLLMESMKAPFQIKIEGNLHEDKFSSISVQGFLGMTPDFPAQNFKADFVYDKTNLFLSSFYSQLNPLLVKAKNLAPDIEKYKTYQLILPILRNEKWLHIAIPEGLSDEESSFSLAEQKDNEKIASSFGDAVIYRKLDQNFQQDGKVFSRITIGLNKEKLLKALNDVKDSTRNTMKLSDFNKLVGFAKAVDSWNSDWIEILVQKDDGMLRQIALNFPGLSKAELTKLGEFVSPESASSDVQDVPKLDHFFVIKFDNYNTAPEVAKITNFVEVDPIVEAAKVELLPLLGKYLQAFGGGM